jgi:CBS domain-containing protein
MLVSHILKSKGSEGVVTTPPGVSVAQAAEILSSRKIGALVISKDGKTLGGIVSERDIVREIGRRGSACLNDTVDSIMTARVVTCALGDQTDAVLQKMTDGRFRHIPVVVEGNQLVGLISIGDVVKARLSELAMEKDALEGMIKGF